MSAVAAFFCKMIMQFSKLSKYMPSCFLSGWSFIYITTFIGAFGIAHFKLINVKKGIYQIEKVKKETKLK